MQWLLALLIAAFLIIPGVEILHMILVEWLGLYEKLTLEQACLIILVVLQTFTLVQLVMWRREIEWEREAQQPPQVVVPPRRRSEEPVRRAAGSGPARNSRQRANTATRLPHSNTGRSGQGREGRRRA